MLLHELPDPIDANTERQVATDFMSIPLERQVATDFIPIPPLPQDQIATGFMPSFNSIDLDPNHEVHGITPTEEDIIYAKYRAKMGYPKFILQKPKTLFLIFDISDTNFNKSLPKFLGNSVPNYEGENLLVGAHDLVIHSIHYADVISVNRFYPRSSVIKSIYDYQEKLEKYRDDIIDFEFTSPRTDGLTKENILYNINHALKLFKNIFKKWHQDSPDLFYY